jgi:hypothetical protein
MRIHIYVKNTTWKITKGNKVRLIMIHLGRVRATANQAFNAAFQLATPTILKTDRC